MRAKFWSMVCLLSGVALSVSFASAPESEMRLWVLQEPGQVVEYDPSTWAVINRVKVPVEFTKDPVSLQINRNGQMLFCADPQIQFGNSEQHFPADKVWLWNGQSAEILDRFPDEKETAAARKNAAVERSRWWALSSDGRHLYRFENEFRIVRNVDGADVSVSTSYRVWETDLNGGQSTVEVILGEDPSSRSVVLPHATLVGWLNQREILVVGNGTLEAIDVRSGARRTFPIRVAKESTVFLR